MQLNKLVHKHFFAIYFKMISLANVYHSLTISNNQVYSDDEFDLWPVYSGE